ncbi:MAG: tRNA 2-selenouridine(34) synthase MnmH [Caulobacteraceae bacterium]|nr:tRNA 2-selenouridine(34) synthase MnmH [Caulobacteraceae bacterium]
MVDILDTVDRASLAAFDDIIDVRTPAEFALDHVPGAVNLPVLTDIERAEVGTIYVQDSRLKARRIGAAHVARNIAAHLEGALKDKPGSYAPLIYCWRGGMRSNALATVLSQVGWRVTVVGGGYKTWRRHVTAALYNAEPGFKVVLLDGYTGSAKTEILGRLNALGVQALDLEGLAGHRGSLFGALAGRPQPSQKLFETRLLARLDELDPARPVVVEAESSKIGERMVPPTVWKAMAGAPRIELGAPRAARARYLALAYGDIAADREALCATLAKLPGRHGAKRLAAWRGLARDGAFEALAESLAEHHYDPAYERSRRAESRPSLGVIEMDSLEPDAQDAAAAGVVRLMSAMGAAP